ncbi:MAG TPA: glycosyltransferase family 2 protein [Candidatus Kapabacteria bacterium]|nr:glycosyltransferase family 2 protein [Candidatus Kapabacteria bacterium]
MDNFEKKSLTVVIPAYNEGEALAVILPELLVYAQKKNWKIIIVNDGSEDNTKEILNKYAGYGHLKTIHHKLNGGYGRAIKSGIEAVDTEYMTTIDADGQHNFKDIDKLQESITVHDADMVVGAREGIYSTSKFRGGGKWLIRHVAKLLMTVDIYDINSSMKIYQSQLAKQYIHLFPDSMAFSDVITLIFIKNKHYVLETPIEINNRIAGKSTGRTNGTNSVLQTIMEILNIIVFFNPMKIFLPTALVFIILGLAWGIPMILKGEGVTVGMSLLIIMGIFSFLLGLIAEQLSEIRKKIENRK